MYTVIVVDESTNEKIILRTADGASIPKDPGNRDFQEFLDWNAEQETPLILE